MRQTFQNYSLEGLKVQTSAKCIQASAKWLYHSIEFGVIYYHRLLEDTDYGKLKME